MSHQSIAQFLEQIAQFVLIIQYICHIKACIYVLGIRMRRTCLTQNTWKVGILTCEIMAKRRAVIFNKYILVKPRF